VQLQLGAGCRCNTLGLLHSVRPDTCGTVTAAARTVPRCISNHVVTAARDAAHAEVQAFQLAARRATASCFRRGCMPACREMPSSVPAVWDGRWRSGPMQGVDVQWETHSARCAATSGTETLRPLIRAARAGSSDSSESMPLEVAARSSPAVVDGIYGCPRVHDVNSGHPR
ncbi:hypothetical protein TcG_11280, partial [Trypanosoma cruzi]